MLVATRRRPVEGQTAAALTLAVVGSSNKGLREEEESEPDSEEAGGERE